MTATPTLQTETGLGDGLFSAMLIPVEQIGGLAIHCSDPRFGNAFAAFIESRGMLHPASYVRIGGALPFCNYHHEEVTAQAWAAIKLLIKKFHITRIIAINHGDCGAYGEHCPEHTETDIVEDLRRFRRLAIENCPGVAVELYWAKPGDDGVNVEFYPVS